jgi:hypothetical protein
MAPRIQIIPTGNLGNQMLQLMLAESLKANVPGLEIGGVSLPDWGQYRRLQQPLQPNRLRLIGQYVDMLLLQRLLTQGVLKELEVAALGFRMAHYLPRQVFQQMFQPKGFVARDEFSDALLINVRGAEILKDTHEDYGPIAVSFYKQLSQATALRPVFMGQIGSDAYSMELRAAFPGALFLASRGPMGDFELMRSARHLAISVSTFSWLAAWLSEAESIHVPVSGILNPLQRPDIDLLPVEDPRYRFYRFPVRRWKGTQEQFKELTQPSDFEEMRGSQVRNALQEGRTLLEAGVSRYRRTLVACAWAHKFFGYPSRVRASF